MSQAQRTERLLNLLFVLMASRRPVPKAALRTSLQDYAESPSDAAFERMFERDKEELRSMGIPIETVEGSIGAGGIDGYRVRGDEYALPEVSFSAEELTVLALAARVWEQASLGPAARSALRKLEASGGEAPHDPSGLIARVTTPEPSFPAFLAACQARRPVTFDYRKPSETTPRTRRLEPWGVLSRKGHWYVAGQDPDRGAPRVFRLSRVVGEVRPDETAVGAFVPPQDGLLRYFNRFLGLDNTQMHRETRNTESADYRSIMNPHTIRERTVLHSRTGITHPQARHHNKQRRSIPMQARWKNFCIHASLPLLIGLVVMLATRQSHAFSLFATISGGSATFDDIIGAPNNHMRWTATTITYKFDANFNTMFPNPE